MVDAGPLPSYLRGCRRVFVSLLANLAQCSRANALEFPRISCWILAGLPARAADAAPPQTGDPVSAYGPIVLLCLLLGITVIVLIWRLVIQHRRLAQESAARLALERSAAERAAQVEASKKELDSIGYSISHDLRAPLRAVDGFSRILEEDHGAQLDEEGRRLLEVVRANSQKIGRMIDDVLAYSRVSRKQLAITDIDMRHLAEDALDGIGGAGGRLAGWVVGELPPARGDASLLRQVWDQLLANAVKFSAAREQPLIEVSGHEDAVENVYRVKDNGVGFDMRYHDKAFELFQRLHTDEQFPGDGSGLAIVKRIVIRHGGRVWAESTQNEGATFYFSLPKATAHG